MKQLLSVIAEMPSGQIMDRKNIETILLSVVVMGVILAFVIITRKNDDTRK